MAIFGRRSARQRLRKATRDSLAIPVFSAPVDCTPWVIGGLWPAELTNHSDETASLAEYLKVDLRRIANSANDELMRTKRLGLTGAARQAAESRVINDARALAVRRVDSTLRQLREATQQDPAEHPGPSGLTDPSDTEETRGRPAVAVESPADIEPAPVDSEPPAEARIEAEPRDESDDERLRRLLAFVVRQEPRLNWAIGELADGVTVLVTDLAHGWVPPGIALPADVRLLEPERRSGSARALIGSAQRVASYSPGDPLGPTPDPAATASSLRPRELPVVADLGWELSEAAHWRDGLPRTAHTLVKAASAGSGVVEEELDLLRVDLDTARYQLLLQHPEVDPALLLDCLLLAAAEALVTADTVSANYHLAWFRVLGA